MNPSQLAKRQERGASERLVIQRVQEGFRVYAADEPKNRYMVSGSPEALECTCPDFQIHRSDPGWECRHVLAVLNEYSKIEVGAQSGDTHEAEERRAIQEESRTPKKRKPAGPSSNDGNGVSQLLLKRSVSPDGRIDSLSVELSTPVDGLTASDIHTRAERMLRLQSGIVAQFLERPERSNGNGRHERSNGDTNNASSQRSARTSPSSQPAVPAASTGAEPAVPAKLVDLAGMDGKWGRRLFLNVEVNGRTLKLFGRPEELAAHVRAAGYLTPEPFCEGAVLNIPCTVTTKPSPDGRYTNVERVLPANPSQPRRQPVRRIDR